jgi:hypothetical protein
MTPSVDKGTSSRFSLSQPTLLLAAALLIAGAAAWPLVSQPGLLSTRGGGDSPFLLQRLHQLTTAVADGHFPVRWMPDANYGYGYPFYNFYAPLSIYIAAAFRFLGFGYVRAIQLAQVSGFMVAAWAAFHVGRRWLGTPWAGLLVAAAYTLAPFHMVNVYVRGDSLAEFWAMAFYPLILLAVDRFYDTHEPVGNQGGWRPFLHRRKGQLAWLALTYAGLILSHNVSAVIFSPFLLLYLAYRQWRAATRDRLAGQPAAAPGYHLAGVILALFLALAMATWFWLPALAEQSTAQLKPVTEGYFHYSNHFRGMDLSQGSLVFDYDVAGGRAFRMGLVQTVVIVFGMAGWFYAAGRGRQTSKASAGERPGKGWQALLLLFAVLVATLMITPLSRTLWDHLPLLSFSQFPWRFLSVQALFGALASGGLVLLPGRRIIVPVAIGLLLVASLAGLETDHMALSDADVTSRRLAEYEWFTGNIGSTVSAEYLPPTVQPRPYTSRWLAAEDGRDIVWSSESQGSSGRILERQSDHQRWELTVAQDSTTISLPTLYWPGWQATLNDQPASIRAAPGSGLITLDIPAGEHTVVLRLARTPLRRAAELISLAAGLLVLGLLVWPRPAGSMQRPRLRRPRLRTLILLVTLLLLAAGLRRLSDGLRPDQVLMTWDFDQLGYLHSSPKGISFTTGDRLANYEYGSEQVAPGEAISIALYWEHGTGQEATLTLATPAVNRVDFAPLLASQSRPTADGWVTYSLAIPDNAPVGLYVPRLTIAGGPALTESGQSRGDLFLRPLTISAQAAAPVTSDADLNLDVRPVEVALRSPELLDVQLQWLTQAALTHSYNFSLRLTDAGGRELAQFDGQPGFGFQPSSGWPPGRWVNDWLALPLPAGLTEETTPYALIVRLYEVTTGTAGLTRRLGELTWEGDGLRFRATERAFTNPDNVSPAEVTFDDLIALYGYSWRPAGDGLELTLYWQALAPIPDGYYHFIHLVDAQTGEIVAQHDSMPRNNSYPTDQWAPGEFVDDPLYLDLSQVPPGEYRLYAGLYQNLGDQSIRLPAVDSQGQRLADDRFLLLLVGDEIAEP